MPQNNTRLRRILLLLSLLLLCSIAYLSLEYATYYEGSWQLVSGAKSHLRPGNQQGVELNFPARLSYPAGNWDIVRGGRLFLKPLPTPVAPIESEPIPEPQPIPEPTPVVDPVPEPVKPEPTPIPIPVPPKPTCPYVVVGIIVDKNKGMDSASAILVNSQNQASQTVRKGAKLGEFEVLQIAKDYVLVKTGETEFKLELGGR